MGGDVMTLLEKINYLNKACKNALTIGCYGLCWKIASYGDDTPLQLGTGKSVEGRTLEEAIEAAMMRVNEGELAAVRKEESLGKRL